MSRALPRSSTLPLTYSPLPQSERSRSSAAHCSRSSHERAVGWTHAYRGEHQCPLRSPGRFLFSRFLQRPPVCFQILDQLLDPLGRVKSLCHLPDDLYENPLRLCRKGKDRFFQPFLYS